MPLYMYVVRNQRIRSMAKVVVAMPRGTDKVRFRTLLWGGDVISACSHSAYGLEYRHRVDRIVAIFWDANGNLISQATVMTDQTEITAPANAVYVEWRVPSGAVFTSDFWGTGSRDASQSLTTNVMSFISSTGNVTDVNINLVLVCSGWDSPITVTSSEVPINIDIPFCHNCGGDFSPRSALRGIYAVIKNSQNAKLQAVLLDGNKAVLATCPEQAVGDISTDTEIYLCPDNDPDLVGYLKTFYPDTRYIRVRVDRSNPAGPLPAAVFTIYFSLDKGSIP